PHQRTPAPRRPARRARPRRRPSSEACRRFRRPALRATSRSWRLAVSSSASGPGCSASLCETSADLRAQRGLPCAKGARKRAPFFLARSQPGMRHAPLARSECERVAQELDEIEAAAPEVDLPRWDLKRGAEIDPTLVVIDKLGEGTRYEAYRAWDRELFCETAVKVVRPHRGGDHRALEGLERESPIGLRMR